MVHDFNREHRSPVPLNMQIPAGNAKPDLPILVLYVDDEPALLDPIRHYLERRGNFSVDTITSANDALVLLQKKNYDVIVSDYQMPGMDGIQLLRKLRDEKNQIPFIIFTGKGHEEVVIEAYNAGADFYIPKGGNPKAMFIDLTQKITQIVTRRRSEVALFESEERYRKVVEQSHDAIFIYQGSGIIFANDRVQEITGYTRQDLAGMDIRTILHPEDRERLEELGRNRVTGMALPETFEARIFTKTGDTRYLEIAITHLATAGEDAILGSVRDITDRKLAEVSVRKSEEKYHTIFNSFDDLYYQTDMSGTITILSPSCKKITGWEASELIGLQVLDLYPFPLQRKELLDNMFSNGEVHDYEVILKNRNGDHLNVSVTSHLVRDENGVPVAIEGTLRDITGRIRAEKALQASEERYRTLADFLPVMVFETDLTGMLTFGNRLILPVFGIDPREIGNNINVLDYLVPEEREKARTNLAKLFSGVPCSSHEYTLVRKDGTRFPTMITASPIFDEKTGSAAGMRGVIIDLTERKLMEEAIRTSEQRLHAIIDGSAIPLFVISREHKVIYWNKSLERYCGIQERDIVGTPDAWKAFYETKRPVLAELLIDNDLDKIPGWYAGKYQESKHTPGAYEVTDFFPRLGTSGTWLHITAVVIRDGNDEVIGSLETLEDITERKMTEQQLISSENYLKTIFNSVQTALVVIDPANHRIVDVNPAALTLMEAERNQIVGAGCQQTFCPSREGKCPIDSAGERVDSGERLIVSHKGRKIPVFKTVLPVTIAGKEYLLENIVDITDRKRAEDAMQTAYFEMEKKVGERTLALSDLTRSLQSEIAERSRVMDALRVSEEKYRSLVEQTNDLVFHIDKDGRLTYISPNVTAILGFTDTETIGASPAEFMPESDRPAFHRLHEQNITEQAAVSGIELTIYDKDHRPHIFEINGTPHFGMNKEFLGFSGIARDITYRKALQDEIAASLREKEILLKEIHHRVKNNMQVISSLLNLQAKSVRDTKSREAIKESQNRVMSIALVHEKLYQSKSLARINFRGYIKKMAENLFDSYNVHPDRIRLEVEADDIVLPISKAIPVSLIINEMLSNSLKYAFPGDRQGIVEIVFRREDEKHMLTIRDNGIGLPEGFALDKTETLGLQLVHSLVGQLDGTISFSREKGTEFRIEFLVGPSEGEHYE
jgi:PAS domain S-box-containing protein